jgi:phosphoadenosine phosphosulfate reductase
MLVENTLFGIDDKVEKAIARLQSWENSAIKMNAEGYHVAFSGGKDSIVILDLVRRAGVKHTTHYQMTTVDPPELIYFIRENYTDVEFHKPEKTMWDLIVEKRMPPTRRVRYCCEYLKERGGSGSMVVTGVRWAESARRANRKMVEPCFKDDRKVYLHAIIDWSEDDVWQYIRERKMKYCCLYDEGFTRVGCIMCPMAEKRRHNDAKRWPKFASAYIRAFQRMIEKRVKDGLETKWKTGQEVYDWWMNEPKRTKIDESQGVLFE